MSRFILYIIIASSLSFNSFASKSIEELSPQIGHFNSVIRQQIEINSKGQDVHVFNGKLKPFAPLLVQCNEALRLNDPWPPTFVLDWISILRSTHEFDEKFEVEITKLKAYLNQGLDYDNETGMYVSHMLTSIFNYIKLSEEHDHFNTLSEFFFYLNQNTIESGGCFPGYAGRLMLVNSLLINRLHVERMKDIAELDELLAQLYPSEQRPKVE